MKRRLSGTSTGTGRRGSLQAVQRFYMRSLARDLGSAVAKGTDFQTLTSKDKAAKESRGGE